MAKYGWTLEQQPSMPLLKIIQKIRWMGSLVVTNTQRLIFLWAARSFKASFSRTLFHSHHMDRNPNPNESNFSLLDPKNWQLCQCACQTHFEGANMPELWLQLVVLSLSAPNVLGFCLIVEQTDLQQVPRQLLNDLWTQTAAAGQTTFVHCHPLGTLGPCHPPSKAP